MIWFTSDWHLGHQAVIGFCERPFASVTVMDTEIMENYRARVRPQDTVYFLGDISFYTASVGLPLLTALPGRKILVQGNHDHYSHAQYERCGFQVFEKLMIRLFGRFLWLCHYPRAPLSEQVVAGEVVRYPERRPPEDDFWVIHGHTHDKTRVYAERKGVHVGVDAWGFQPVSMTQIESLIARTEGAKDERN